MNTDLIEADICKSKDLFYVIDKTNDRFLYISESFVDMLAISIDNVSSACATLLQALHHDDRPRMQNRLTNLHHGTSIEEFRLLRQDGTHFWIKNCIHVVPINAVDIYYIGILEDIQTPYPFRRPKQSLELKKLITDLAVPMIQLQPERFHDFIQTTINYMANAVQSDRCYFFQFDRSTETISNISEWCKPGMDSHIDCLQDLPIQDYGWLMKRLYAEEVVNIQDTKSLSLEADIQHGMIDRHNIHSALILPIFANSNLIGSIVFCAISQPKLWADDDIELLKVVTGLIGSAFQRWNDQLKISTQKIRLSLALEIVGGMLFDIDVAARTVYVSENLLDKLGVSYIYADQPLLLDDIWQYVHPDDVARLSQTVADALDQDVQVESVVRLLSGTGSYLWFRIRGQVLIHPLTQQKRLVGIAEDLSRKLRQFLTEREIEVLYLLINDLTSRGIAQKLGISIHTVNNHLRSIYAKLGVNSRLEAVLKANSLGLIYL